MNTLINAVIALVEGRPKDAREMLRSPAMRVSSSSEVQIRLAKAIRQREDEAVVKAMKATLQITLRVDVKAEAKRLNTTWDESHEEAFLHGMAYVEEILDEHITALSSPTVAG